ncbi:hypothetical protein QUA20_26815, partial [Microcoleus sp. Pol7_A1]|uniref:hypothetical protein n=1 Tax=Microcoleus sp. Pol7_A1 TaxID=2818893 RepID=UPI002FD55A88
PKHKPIHIHSFIYYTSLMLLNFHSLQCATQNSSCYAVASKNYQSKISADFLLPINPAGYQYEKSHIQLKNLLS